MKKSLILSAVLVGMVGCAQAQPVQLTPEQMQAKQMMFSVCQGEWNEAHDEFTVTNKDECLEASNRYKEQFEQMGMTEAAEFIEQFQDDFDL